MYMARADRTNADAMAAMWIPEVGPSGKTPENKNRADAAISTLRRPIVAPRAATDT